jgi:hypothetical protein
MATHMTTKQLLIPAILLATRVMFFWRRWRHDMLAAVKRQGHLP